MLGHCGQTSLAFFGTWQGLGQGLARTWQEIGSPERLKQPEFVLGGLGGDLGRLGSIW